LYAALGITSGKVIGALHSRTRAIEFRKFLATIDREVPAHLDVHPVLDNASTCKTAAIHRWLTTHPRFHLHFTPTSTSSSWLNLVPFNRALVPRSDHQGTPAQHPPVSRRAQHQHSCLDPDLERDNERTSERGRRVWGPAGRQLLDDPPGAIPVQPPPRPRKGRPVVRAFSAGQGDHALAWLLPVAPPDHIMT